MLELTQCFRLDLTDTLTGNRELLTNFFQRVVGVHTDTKTHTLNTFFSRGQRCQNTGCGITQVCLNGCINRQQRILIFNEVAQM